MKFYCKKCGSVVTIGDKVTPEETPFESYGMECRFCWEHEEIMQSVPDYETPEQYEKRTGKPYPDNGLVWIYFNPLYEWRSMTYRNAGLNKNGVHGEMYTMIVIADPPVPLPDNWRPQ